MDNKDEIIAKLIQDVEEIKKEITQMKQRRQFRSEEKEQELKDRRKETNRKYYLKKKELKKQSVQNI